MNNNSQDIFHFQASSELVSGRKLILKEKESEKTLFGKKTSLFSACVKIKYEQSKNFVELINNQGAILDHHSIENIPSYTSLAEN